MKCHGPMSSYLENNQDLVYFLRNCDALAHDECVGQEDERPHPNLGMRQDSVAPDGDHGLAVGARIVPICGPWLPMYLCYFPQTFGTSSTFVENAILLQKSDCRFWSPHFIAQRDEIVRGVSWGHLKLWNTLFSPPFCQPRVTTITIWTVTKNINLGNLNQNWKINFNTQKIRNYKSSTIYESSMSRKLNRIKMTKLYFKSSYDAEHNVYHIIHTHQL